MPGSQVFIIGPNHKQTTKIITPLINEICEDAPKGLITRTKSELLWKVGESTLLIGAFDTANESLRGMRANAIFLEESGLAGAEDYEYTLRSVLRPTLMHSKGRMVHLTTPAVELDHPLHRESMPKAAMNGALYTYTIRDNPLLTPEEIEKEIEDMGGLESVHCQRELFCQLVKDEERLLVPEFFEELHVKPIIAPPYKHWLTSVDFGGSRDNHGAILAYYDFIRGKYVILDEVFLAINTGTDEIVAKCLEMEARNVVIWPEGLAKRVIDAAGQTHVDIKRLGFKCSLPLKGKDSVLEGINALRVAFKQGQIEVHPRCVHLIQALKYGMWDKLRKDFARSEALGHCDMIAALVYNFRHINMRSNPWPANLGMHKETHYYDDRKKNDMENEEAVEKAFYD